MTVATKLRPSQCREDNEGKENGAIPCFQCGVCCTSYQVRLNLVEARRICDGLGLKWNTFLGRYIDPQWPGSDSFLLRKENGACIFLKDTNIPGSKVCLIHMFKPSACRDWNSSLYRRECQQGLAKDWGLTVDTEGKLCGSDEKIHLLKIYLESLNTAGCSEAYVETEGIKRYESGRFENRREESI
jgi:uncharacterized protein